MVNETVMVSGTAITIFPGTFQSGSRSPTGSVSRLVAMPAGSAERVSGAVCIEFE